MMRKQRGFILPSGLTLYAAIGAAVVIGLMAIALKVQTSRLETSKAETDTVTLAYKTFADGVAVLGNQAEEAAVLKNTEYQLNKEKADHENIANRTRISDLNKRLRDSRENSGSRLVPEAPSGAASPLVAAFDRAALDRALSIFEGEVTGIIEEGDRAIVDLNSSRTWASGIN